MEDIDPETGLAYTPFAKFKKHWKSFLLIASFPICFYHLFLFLLNFNSITVNMLFFSYNTTVSSLVFHTVLYTFAVTSGFYYYFSYSELLIDIKQLKEDKANLTSDKESRDRKIALYAKNAANVLVPFPLDQLVEKSIDNPTQHMFKPGTSIAKINAPC